MNINIEILKTNKPMELVDISGYLNLFKHAV